MLLLFQPDKHRVRSREIRLAVRLLAAVVAGASSFSLVAVAWADGGDLVRPDNWTSAWHFDPLVIFNLSLLGWLYFRGVRQLLQRGSRIISAVYLQPIAFAAALVALSVALLSPLDPLGEQLAWAHMVQHMILMMIAAPLFVFALPGVIVLRGLPHTWRQDIVRCLRRLRTLPLPWNWLWQPAFAWLFYAAALWVWHWPVLYQAALHRLWVHDLQHLTFFVAGCLFWRLLLDPAGARRLSRGAGVIYLFTTSLHATVLGVFMALAPVPWYADYYDTARAWGLSALEDQQLAGLLMWVPACLLYPAAAAILFGLWLAQLTKSPTQTMTTRPAILAENQLA